MIDAITPMVRRERKMYHEEKAKAERYRAALEAVRDWYRRDDPRLAIVIEKVETALADIPNRQ